MKNRKSEQIIADAISKFITIWLFILFYSLRLIAKASWRLKRYLFRLAVVILITWSAYTTLHTVVYAPKANATLNGYNTVAGATTEHQQIINYINEVFGKDAPKAFKLLTECGENKALNPLAVNWNNDQYNSQDFGVFQINNHWQGVSGRFLKNWKVNIEVAHQIYTESGNNFHLWTGGRKCQI